MHTRHLEDAVDHFDIFRHRQERFCPLPKLHLEPLFSRLKLRLGVWVIGNFLQLALEVDDLIPHVDLRLSHPIVLLIQPKSFFCGIRQIWYQSVQFIGHRGSYHDHTT